MGGSAALLAFGIYYLVFKPVLPPGWIQLGRRDYVFPVQFNGNIGAFTNETIFVDLINDRDIYSIEQYTNVPRNPYDPHAPGIAINVTFPEGPVDHFDIDGAHCTRASELGVALHRNIVVAPDQLGRLVRLLIDFSGSYDDALTLCMRRRIFVRPGDAEAFLALAADQLAKNFRRKVNFPLTPVSSTTRPVTNQQYLGVFLTEGLRYRLLGMGLVLLACFGLIGGSNRVMN